jgi:hypothetical protein
MPRSERAEHVAWALELVQAADRWWTPLVEWRMRQLQESHDRLRKLLKEARLQVQPHLPPDILGCYVLVPAERGPQRSPGGFL